MKKIVLDAGHSEAPKSFSREDEIALIICNLTQALILKLTAEGAENNMACVVIPVVDKTGKHYGLMDKVYFANGIKADLFISVHLNWSDTNKKASGFNIYIDDKDRPPTAGSRRFAEILAGQFEKIGWAGFGKAVDIDTHTGPGNLAVCSYTTMPAVLIEMGFLSNPEDAARVEKRDEQEKIAVAIYKAAKLYFL